MRICVVERVGLQDGAYKFCVSLEQLVQHLTIVYVVPSAWTLRRRRRIQQLRLIYGLDVNQLIEGVDGCSVQVVRQVVHARLQILVPLVEEVLRSSALTVIT